MPPINVISALFIVIGCAMLLRAYAPIISRKLDCFSFYMVRGIATMALILLLRSGYWDILQWATGDNWEMIRDFFGGQKISTVFNVTLLFPVRDFMLARLELVSENERHLWRWWTVWAHPDEKCWINWKRRSK